MTLIGAHENTPWQGDKQADLKEGALGLGMSVSGSTCDSQRQEPGASLGQPRKLPRGQGGQVGEMEG